MGGQDVAVYTGLQLVCNAAAFSLDDYQSKSVPVVALTNKHTSEEKMLYEKMERGENQGWTALTIIPIIMRDTLCLAQPVPMYDLILRRNLMGTAMNGNSMAHRLFKS